MKLTKLKIETSRAEVKDRNGIVTQRSPRVVKMVMKKFLGITLKRVKLSYRVKDISSCVVLSCSVS